MGIEQIIQIILLSILIITLLVSVFCDGYKKEAIILTIIAVISITIAVLCRVGVL